MDTNVATILKTHSTFQDRIANATEGAYAELQVHTGLLRELILTTAGQADRLDRQLATARAAANLSAGVGPSFT